MYKQNVLYMIGFCFIIGLNFVQSARILGIFPTPSISHQVVFRALTEELAVRGHDLVVLTTDPVNYTDPKYDRLKQIDVHDGSYKIWRDHLNFAMDRIKDPSTMKIMDTYFDVMVNISELQLGSNEMQELLNDPSQEFDLCIVEGIIPLFTAFKDRFKCPLIQMLSFIGLDTNYEITGNPNHPVFYFDLFNPYTENEIGFLRKFELIWQRIQYNYLRSWKYDSEYVKLAKKYFGNGVRSYFDIEREVDMIFVNVNPIFSGIRPLVPAVVQMGYMHIKLPTPLPEDIQAVLDNAKEGAVYFSFGSNVRSCDLPAPIINALVRVWKSVPYTILWKWECGEIPDKPANVFTSEWFPQQSVFAHKNLKLFITQGGQQSLEEAIHNGVPMIGMPFMADQAANVARVVKFNIGKRLYIESITEKDLRDAVVDIISNTSYHDNILKLRELIYDQPQTSLERAVWWTEYVIRHKGAKHLRAPTVDMSYAEYYMVYEALFVVGLFYVAIKCVQSFVDSVKMSFYGPKMKRS